MQICGVTVLRTVSHNRLHWASCLQLACYKPHHTPPRWDIKPLRQSNSYLDRKRLLTMGGKVSLSPGRALDINKMLFYPKTDNWNLSLQSLWKISRFGFIESSRNSSRQGRAINHDEKFSKWRNYVILFLFICNLSRQGDGFHGNTTWL